MYCVESPMFVPCGVPVSVVVSVLLLKFWNCSRFPFEVSWNSNVCCPDIVIISLSTGGMFLVSNLSCVPSASLNLDGVFWNVLGSSLFLIS
jgi:hypothetical protein